MIKLAVKSNTGQGSPLLLALSGHPDKVRLAVWAVLIYFTAWCLRFNLIIPSFLLVILFYAKCRKGALKNYSLLSLSFLFTLILSLAYMIVNQGLSRLYIPITVVPMLVALLFNQLELVFLVSLAVAVSVAAIAGNSLYLGVLFFTSSLASGVLVINARRRITIIRAGFIIGLLQVLLLFFIWHFEGRLGQVSLRSYSLIFANGLICSIIVLGLLPVFEYLFKIVTNISMLELADFNHPLLQKMIMEAPGTYHHSLIVGNLSESACRAVGANALLARIGAYYHDIGKLQKPEYFSENQESSSKHDHLSPTMSKMVIMNHVKDGVELARKYRLNQSIIDFIEQHHGNSLVYYFYRRALETLEEDQDIKEEGFRYAGPKPATKETAIVLLADSVEAATRGLKDPTPVKIVEVVHKVINNKFIDGQLDECELTLKDLEKISDVFIRILSGIYHGRVSYPEEKK